MVNVVKTDEVIVNNGGAHHTHAHTRVHTTSRERLLSVCLLVNSLSVWLLVGSSRSLAVLLDNDKELLELLPLKWLDLLAGVSLQVQCRAMWRKLLYSGFETCFGPSAQRPRSWDPISKHISNPDLAPF